MVIHKSICLCQFDTCKSKLIFIYKYKCCVIKRWYFVLLLCIIIDIYVNINVLCVCATSVNYTKKQRFVTLMKCFRP